jgi:DNA-binding IclR family transcriptional regulator
MTNHQTTLRLLVTLYRFATRGKIPTVTKLSIETGLTTNEVTSLLGHLDRKGLVESSWPRLTLAGLAVAVAAGARTKTRAYPRAA